MALKGTKALLVWCQRCTEGYKDVKVENMTKSWKDGLAFCAIIHHFRPDLIDFFSLSKENVRENCSLAFEVAERELGIPALLDPEDMTVMQVPDKLSIMTYVSQYYNFFKDKKPAKEGKSKGGKLSLRRSMRKSKDKDKADGGAPRKQATIGDKCKMCGKHVYMIERQVVDGKLFHRACFKCHKCSTTLRPGSYKAGKDPKKYECLHHKQGSDILKMRSKMANRAGSRLAGVDDDDDALWRVQRASSVSGGVAQPQPTKPVSESKPTLHPSAIQTGPVKPTSPPPARPVVKPVTKPPPIPSGANPPAGAIPLHPHLLAAASARSQFAGGGAPQTVKDTGQKTSPVSKETCVDDVVQGSENPAASKQLNINEPIRPRLPSKETCIDEPSNSNTNKTQDTTADSMSLKSGTSDSASITSREGLTTSQDSLLKATDSNIPRKEDMAIEAHDKNKDVNMNAEKSDDEKKLVTAATEHKDVFQEKVVDDKKEEVEGAGEKKEEEEKKSEEESQAVVEEKKDEKWESELVKEDAKDQINDKTVGSEEKYVTEGTKEDESNLIVNNVKEDLPVKEQSIPVDNDVDDSLNPFGDDDDEEEAATTEEVKTEVKLEITANEARENKKNENDTISEDVKAKDIDSKRSLGDVDKVGEDAKSTGSVEMDKLTVQTKDLGDVAKSAGSIDDIYDNDLNPFADEDENANADDYKKEYNPFDESESGEDDDYDDNLNPFGDDDDDAEIDDSQVSSNGRFNPFTGSPVSETPPVRLGGEMRPRAHTERPSRPPPPRATQDQSSMYQVKTRQQILQEMHVNRDTIKMKKKRPAPRRPPPPGEQGSPSPTKRGVVPPPRGTKKERKAPPPPPVQGGTPQKTSPQRPPPITVTPSPQNGAGEKPVPSPRLSLLVSDGENNIKPPVQTKPRLVITPDIQGSSDGEDRPVPSPRRSRRATTCGAPSQLQHSPSSSPSRSLSKRKAPLPPAIKRDVTKDHEDPAIIQRLLAENEKRQRELEQRGIDLEHKLRETMEAPEGDVENEEVLVEWFKLVNDRNKLIRKEGEFIAQIQMQELEVQHADIEYELRCIMNKQDHQRTDADQEKEEQLLEMLVEVVTRRSSVIDRLEADRIREEEEDENIRQMMEESGLTKDAKEKEKEGKKKKSKKKKDKTIWHIS